ncbi:MAG: hypothetical protein ABSC19_03965 [Syntrophorhabdales bacterium]|jgi:hypothetical protein
MDKGVRIEVRGTGCSNYYYYYYGTGPPGLYPRSSKKGRVRTEPCTAFFFASPAAMRVEAGAVRAREDREDRKDKGISG